MENEATPPQRVAGVIGGLGPGATVDFMARVIALTPATSDQDHVRLLVDQNPKVPNRQDAIVGNSESPGPVLAAMAAGLEAAGADFIVMPCNAAHAFAGDIQAAIGIPFVSIVATTVASIPRRIGAVGVLETPAAQKTGLYREALSAAGIRPVELDAGSTGELMQLAYAIKRGDRGPAVQRAMSGFARALVDGGAQAIIMGCTEIPLVLADGDVEAALISSTDALARKTIALARGDSPLPGSEKR